jgi:hypothetical protein
VPFPVNVVAGFSPVQGNPIGFDFRLPEGDSLSGLDGVLGIENGL